MKIYPLSYVVESFKPAFTCEKSICRIIASWISYTAAASFGSGKFYELSFAQDKSVFFTLAMMFLFFICYSAVAALFVRYYTDSFFLLGSSTLCAVQWLVFYRSTEGRTLFALAVLFVYCLILYYFILKNRTFLERLQPENRSIFIFVVFFGLVCGTVIAIITCLRYKTFSSPNFDLGIFSQMFHYMKETGIPLVTSERDMLLSHFAVHISPIYYLLLPFYCIFPSPLTLQIGQALILASGVVPVLFLARYYKLSGKATMLVCLIYSFYPAVSCGTFYDIHENCFLAPLLLWMFYFFERKKTVLIYLFAFAVLMVKEDAAVYLMIFAVYAILSRKRYWHGTTILAGSALYFLLSTFLINNFGDGVMIDRYYNLIFDSENGFWGILKTALQNPGYLLTQIFSTEGADLSAGNFFFESSTWAKVVYFIHLLFPLGMIPFCTKKPSRWLLITPILLNLLTTYRYQYSIIFQYNFAITAFLIYTMIQNIPELKASFRPYILSFGAAACCILYMATVVPTLTGYMQRWENNKDMYIEMEEMLDTIPTDASLNVSSLLLPHVWNRDILYETGHHGNKTDIDFVVLDKRYDFSDFYRAYKSSGYTVYAESEYILILKHPAVYP